MSQLPSLRSLLGIGRGKQKPAPSQSTSPRSPEGAPATAVSLGPPQPMSLAPPLPASLAMPPPVYHKQMPPQPLLSPVGPHPLPPAPAAAPHVLHTGDAYTTRDQSVHAMHDRRYWPYARGSALPVHAAPLAVSQPLAVPESAYDASPIQYMPGGAADPRRHYGAWHRQRRTRACQNCHLKKVKCEGDGVRCVNCLRANVECKWIPMKKRGPKPKSRPVAAETAAPPPSRTDTAAQTPMPNGHYESAGNEGPAATTHSAPVVAAIHAEAAPAIAPGETVPAAAPPLHTKQSAAATAMPLPLGADFSGQPAPEPAAVHTANGIPGAGARTNSANGAAGAVEPFNQIVRGSEIGGAAEDSIEDVLRRFYSDEVPEDTRNAVVYYFGYFYGICPIFHPASFIRRIVNGEVDQILIDSLRASAARLINKYTDTYVDLDRLIEDIEERLLSYLGEPNLDYVRAVAIMASLNGGECRFMMYNALTCLAASLVTRLGWHMLDAQPVRPDITWDEWVNLEIKRRTFFIVYLIDGYLAMISDRSMTLPPERIMTRPPGSTASWDDMAVRRLHDKLPTFFDAMQPASGIIKSASVVYSCVEMASLSSIMARLNDFLWKAKIALSTYSHGDDFKPNVKFLKRYTPTLSHVALPIKSLFAFDEFRHIHEDLMEWRRRLLDTNDLDHFDESDLHLSNFGNHAHRLQLMRVRYFCLYTYSAPVLHCLHLTNRPSYFETQLRNKVFVEMPEAVALAQTDVPENKFIYEILSSVFADRLNLGLLAYDVAEDSWRICVDSVYDLVRCLDRHRDIPLERYDQTIPFCLLTSLTVLIRNARMCRHKIEEAAGSSPADMDGIRQDLAQSTTAMRRLWALLGDLNDVWRISGIEYLLRMMQIEEVVNAADLFSGLSL